MTSTPSPALRWTSAILLFIAAGLAVVLPFVSGTFLTLLIGGVAIAAGVAQLLRLGGEGNGRSKLLRALSGALYVAGGVFCLLYPVASEVSFTLFIGFLMTFEGITELAAAAAGSGPARSLVLTDGIVTTILGALLIAEWPSDSLWAIGTLFGIGLAFSAVNLITAPAAPEA